MGVVLISVDQALSCSVESSTPGLPPASLETINLICDDATAADGSRFA